MKSQAFGAIVSSMTDRRVDSTLLARRAIKKALSSVRLLCDKFRREVADRNDRIVGRKRANEIAARLQANVEEEETERWNSSNENLENELRELAMKTSH